MLLQPDLSLSQKHTANKIKKDLWQAGAVRKSWLNLLTRYM